MASIVREIIELVEWNAIEVEVASHPQEAALSSGQLYL